MKAIYVCKTFYLNRAEAVAADLMARGFRDIGCYHEMVFNGMLHVYMVYVWCEEKEVVPTRHKLAAAGYDPYLPGHDPCLPS